MGVGSRNGSGGRAMSDKRVPRVSDEPVDKFHDELLELIDEIREGK